MELLWILLIVGVGHNTLAQNVPDLQQSESLCNERNGSYLLSWCDVNMPMVPPRFPNVFDYKFTPKNYTCVPSPVAHSSNYSYLYDECYMTFAAGIGELPLNGSTEKILAVTAIQDILIFALDFDEYFIITDRLDENFEFDLCSIINIENERGILVLAATQGDWSSMITVVTGNRFVHNYTTNLELRNADTYLGLSIVQNKIFVFDPQELPDIVVFGFFYEGEKFGDTQNSLRALISFVNVPQELGIPPNVTFDSLQFIFYDGPPSNQLTMSFESQLHVKGYMSLVAIAGSDIVHIFLLINETVLTFSWKQESKSMFYKADPTEAIIGAQIFSEVTPRAVKQLSRNVWLALLTQQAGNTFLKVILLQEFGMMNSTSSVVDDPASRGELCPDINQWRGSDGVCSSRLMYTFPIIAENPVTLNMRHIQTFTNVSYYINSFSQFLQTEAYTALFVGYDNQIAIYGFRPMANTSTYAYVEFMSSYDLIGNVKHVTVSQNGQHVFAFLSRKRWELMSLERIYNICQVLAMRCEGDPNGSNCTELNFRQQVLASFNDTCNNNPIRLPNLNDFMEYIGLCPRNTFCSKVYEMDISSIESGYYSNNSFQKSSCEPGFFCVLGIRTACPIGNYCPGILNSRPLRCRNAMGVNNKTCFGEQLQEPQDCQPGSVCEVAYLPPFPSPPGFYSPIDDRDNFQLCPLGEYCPIGRQDNEVRLCPERTYCNTSDVITPEKCTVDTVKMKSSYCPEGTTYDRPCTVGYWCTDPANRTLCPLYNYCPEGSLFALQCPGGSYCENPATIKTCPKGHFCPNGTVDPYLCTPLAYCPEGTAKQINFTILFVFFIVLLLIAGIWKGAHHLVDQRHKEKKEAIESLRAEYAKNIGGDDFHILNDSFSTVQIQIPKKTHTVDISFENLSLKLHKKGHVVLSGVNGVVKAGRVTAIMGPSGAGKTTFMTTLAGKAYYGKTGGIIRINGVETSIDNIRAIMGYVPQEDVMHRMLTVKDILNFNANMRLSPDIPHKDKRSLVNSVINLLGLGELAYSPIGDESKRGISGGQRKRVNIGMELVANPTVLFLDEPTSGLDSTSSLELAKILRSIATLGLTVVTVIHQPRYDIFTMFDDVLLLGKGGKTVFLGPSNQALPYFVGLGFKIPKHSNPADFFMDIISGQVPRKGYPNFKPTDLFVEWEQYSKQKIVAVSSNKETVTSSDEDTKDTKLKSREEIPIIEPKIAPDTEISMTESINTEGFNKAYFKSKKAGWFYQLFLCCYRAIKQQAAEFRTLGSDVFLVFLIGLIFGCVFLKAQYIGAPNSDVCSCINGTYPLYAKCLLPILDPFFTMGGFVGLALGLVAATFSLRVFGNEKVIFWRESSAGVNTFAYFLGKDLAYLPHSILLPLLFLGIFFTLVPLNGQFSFYYALMLLIWYNGTAMGYFVSIVMKPSMAQLTVVILIFMLMLFSGLQPTLPDINKTFFPPLNLLPYLSFLRYGNELFYRNEMYHYQYRQIVETGLEVYGYQPLDDKQWEGYCWLALFLIGTGFRIISVVLLELFDRKKRL